MKNKPEIELNRWKRPKRHVAEVHAIENSCQGFIEHEISNAGWYFQVAIEHVSELAVGVYNVENNGVRAGFQLFRRLSDLVKISRRLILR